MIQWYIRTVGLANINIVAFIFIQIALVLMCAACLITGAYIAAAVFIVYGQIVAMLVMYLVRQDEKELDNSE